MTRRWLSFILLIGAACSKAPTTPLIAIGKPLFPFEVAQITELTLAKDDPQTGDRWSASFERKESAWTIAAGPEGATLQDRLADSGIIDHLLDTLRTLRAAEALTDEQGKQGSQWGLAPAAYWLRWKSPQGLQEIKIGAQANPFQRYAWTQGQSLKVEGAFLKMLEYVSDFRKLRFHKLMTWKIDDADRVRVRWSGNSPAFNIDFQAERNTGEWAGPKNRKLRPAVQNRIEALSKLEIESFEGADFKKPWVTLEWFTRTDEALKLEISQDLTARASDRPGAVFRLFDGARALLEPQGFTR